jgi:hypothetical protein
MVPWLHRRFQNQSDLHVTLLSLRAPLQVAETDTIVPTSLDDTDDDGELLLQVVLNNLERLGRTDSGRVP